MLDAWLGGYARGKLSYDPDRPQTWQRNVAHRKVDLARRGAASPEAERNLFPGIGLDRLDQLRVLVCEGADLVAWVGGYRARPFTMEERHTLSSVVPTLRARLLLERHVRGARWANTALGTALEGLGVPAFVLSSRGRLELANQAGRLLFDADRDETLEKLRRATDGGAAAHGAKVSSFDGGWLVLLAATPADDLVARVAIVASRAALTKQQTRVLASLAEGLSNRGIAATLNISQRTVEGHLNAIFDRLGVCSRSAALAEILAPKRSLALSGRSLSPGSSSRSLRRSASPSPRCSSRTGRAPRA